jgi:hypothetical protein
MRILHAREITELTRKHRDCGVNIIGCAEPFAKCNFLCSGNNMDFRYNLLIYNRYGKSSVVEL